jgi:hypothetical protein
MACQEKVRLMRDYEVSTGGFAGAVTDLQRKIGTSSKDEYERLNQVANDGRMKSEQARLALETHIATHGC